MIRFLDDFQPKKGELILIMGKQAIGKKSFVSTIIEEKGRDDTYLFLSSFYEMDCHATTNIFFKCEHNTIEKYPKVKTLSKTSKGIILHRDREDFIEVLKNELEKDNSFDNVFVIGMVFSANLEKINQLILLKELAKKYDVPVFVTVSLGRETNEEQSSIKTLCNEIKDDNDYNVADKLIVIDRPGIRATDEDIIKNLARDDDAEILFIDKKSSKEKYYYCRFNKKEYCFSERY